MPRNMKTVFIVSFQLWLAPPPRPQGTTGISVPSKQDTNGYSFDKRGQLIKNPPKTEGPTFFYNIPREEINLNTRSYKGNFWSRMTGRQDAKVSETPGPGDYEHEANKTAAQVQCEKMREAKRSTSRQSRYLDILFRTKTRENFPAPNAYDTRKSNFDKRKKMPSICRRHVSRPVPFGSTAQRFNRGVYYGTPGPGEYEVVGRGSCTPSIYGAPFGTTSSRLRKLTDTGGPAPTDYHTNVGSLAYESAKRFKSEWPRPISQLPADRTKTIAEREGGAPYYYYDKGEVPKSSVHHAAFKSRTERFQTKRMDSGVPDPGAYETGLAFKANRDRCHFLCRRLAPGFNARADRFPKVPKGIDLHVPGATQYNVAGDIGSNVKGGVIAYPRRKKDEGLSGPGPAHYYMSATVESSVLKKSFNVTLGQQAPPTLVLKMSKAKSKRIRAQKYQASNEIPDYAANSTSLEYQLEETSPENYPQESWSNYKSRTSAPRLVPPVNVCRTYVTSYN